MQIEELPKEKFCKKCNTTKSATQFSIVKWKYKGIISYSLQSACKVCIVRNSTKLQALKPKTPKYRGIETEDLNMMKSPLNWYDMKGEKTSYEYKEYPVCQEGHKYVGPQCLPCKYYYLQRSMV